jgi:hypothetical protein
VRAGRRAPELPDGLFSNQKSKFEQILEGLAMENLSIFYDYLDFFRDIKIFNGHLVYFVVIWYIFPRFGILDQEKSGNPGEHADCPGERRLCG